MRVQNTRCTFDDQPVQLLRSNSLAKCFTEAVQKIEDECLLDLNFFMRTLQTSNTPYLKPRGKNPSGYRRYKEPEKKIRPHHVRASLLRRRLVMKVLS